jgi:hypothetical protein
MALVDPNIAMGYRGIEVPNQLAQYGQLAQIQNAQNQNRMANLQVQEYERAREEEEGTRNFLRGRKLSDPDTLAGLVQFGKTGLNYAKQLQDQNTAALTARNTQSQIDEREFGVRDKKLKFAWNAVGSASTPEAAIAELTKGVKDGVFDMKSVTPEIQQLQNMSPADYQQYRVQKIMGILDAKDKLGFMLPKIERVNTGSGLVPIQANPTMAGFGAPVAGIPVIPKTMTPGEVASNQVARANLKVAQDRLAQDAQGVTYQPNDQGYLVALPSRLSAGAAPVARPVTGQDGAPVKGKPSPFAEKATAQRNQMGKDLDFAIKELTEITKDGGLIDQSTGSGAGRLIDLGARFAGQAMSGDIAIGKIAPIADLTLKMIPRFEGPQSDKDTKSYKEAAGQLADPTLPREIRKEAGKTVLRLMQQRKGQFANDAMAAEGIAPSIAPPPGFTKD